MRLGTGTMKQHQHYVPEPYLTNFSKNRKGRLVVYKRDGTHIKGKAKDFCGENEFYSFVDSSGNLNRSIEEMLAVIDDAGPLQSVSCLQTRTQRSLRKRNGRRWPSSFPFSWYATVGIEK